MQADRRLAIMQPYFFPYLGYFQLMAAVDAFVIFDDVNFINRGWINRNRINLNGAAHLVTVPLQQASQNRLICEIDVSADGVWRTRLLRTIQQAYARASQFRRVFPLIESIVAHPSQNLADYLRHSLVTLRDHLGLETAIVDTSRQYDNAQFKGEARIIDICRREQAARYVNAIGGTSLYDRGTFHTSGIELSFLAPQIEPYPQLPHAGFVAGLSLIDVLMNTSAEQAAALVRSGSLA